MKNTKHTNKMTKTWTFTIAVLILFCLMSCSNIFQKSHSEPEQKRSSDGKTYLVVDNATIRKTSSADRAASGNLGPDTNQIDISKLTDFVLEGRIHSAGQEMKELATASTFEELKSKKIGVEPAVWELILYTKLDGIPFHGTTYQTIEEGKENKIHIVLVADVDYGKLEITVEWTNQASKVSAWLMDAATQQTLIVNKAATSFDTAQLQEPDGSTTAGHKVTFVFDKDDKGQNLASGTYYLSVDFEDLSGSNINKAEYFVNIAKGLTTKTTVRTDLSPTYSITYNDGDGTLVGTSKPMNYNRRSIIILPEMKSDSKFFEGWYDEDGNKVTGPIFGYSKNGPLTFTAHWKNPVLYVSGTGDDTADGLSEATPLETVNKACEKIVELGDVNMDWTIYIMGDVTGPHSSDKKAGSRGTSPSSAGDTDFGRTVIPADITSDYAKSILLIGKTGLDANGNPQDMLNRGLVQNNSTSYKDTGNVIAIATTVPVTIKNLKITGGNNSSPNSNSTNDPYYQNGGGLNIAAGANVTLDDGVLIIKNKACNGGAVYNAGTLTMVGTATIGDSSATTYPQNGITSSTNPASNEYKYGGGIYNTGTLYLGIEGKELTGGIYNSYGYAAFGGGIYNSGNGSVVMSSGKINYNDGQSNGGGVYLNSGTFKMTGGEIFYNSTGDQGGGVYVSNAAVFYFGGGTISGNNANTYGGGVYIKGDDSGSGKMFMYGDAVIGKSSATSLAPYVAAGDTAGEKVAMATGCNMAIYGAGIYAQGELYMGYSDQDVTKPLTGGIFYNTAKVNVNYGYSNGGALYVTGTYANVIMNSGTINYNYAKAGSGIYITSDYFTMTSLTVGAKTYVPIISQSISYSDYYYSINIDSLLASAAAGAYNLVPPKNNDETGYSSNIQLIKLTTAATAQSITINDIKDKFTVEKFTNPKTGITSSWIIDSTGHVVQKAETINVSSSGTCTSISDAAAQMNDSTKDYIIALSGIITGPQTIPGTVQANSITIKGATGTDATNVPNNGINANLADGVEGTALTINTTVPVTLNNICVKGGHGTEKDGAIIGGGLLLGENAHVCLDNNTRILQNITYDKGDGTPGYGAGVYISNKAKLYENKYCHITENTATCRGAGIYIANGGTLQTMAESGSYITLNTFDTNFTDSSNNPVTRCGGAVYIEDGATYEMFGAWLWVNCLDTENCLIDNCLGSGIYLSTTGKLRVKGHTEVVVPNDIYLKNGASIEIDAALDPSNPSNTGGPVITARLKPETYSEGVLLVKHVEGLSDYTFTNAVKRLEVLPSEVSGQTQYWAIDDSGQLVKKTGTDLTVTVPTDINDISISVTSDGMSVAPGSHFTGVTTLKFTAPAGYEEYKWTVDGEEESDTKELTVYASALRKGNYVVYLEAKTTDGKYHSYTAQIKVGDF